jgi:hypothetical protein
VDQTFCNKCGSQLVWRLGAWECLQCGMVAGQPVQPTNSAPPPASFNRPGYVQTESGLQYFSRENNRTLKLVCIWIYGAATLVPLVLLTLMFVVAYPLITQSGEETTRIANLTLAIGAIGIVVLGFQVIIYYLVLFSDIYWLKWAGLIYNFLGIPMNIGLLLLPERMLNSDDYAKYENVAGGWFILLAAMFGLAWTILLVRLLWPDIVGLRLNRKLGRHYA